MQQPQVDEGSVLRLKEKVTMSLFPGQVLDSSDCKLLSKHNRQRR